ncbi:DUF1501 domain-containing protein [Reyranella sp. CPCC 100927]|uniref:DUF1501 domain-containing protein n=1 Tax=Reyranella sp. CPCC 100927 TaxID=2599616 RepID=UPI0011B3E83F|nr:DUF1501 domain-containing protein [Reyranella sp. CPCC 100927]TWT05626.1 DUF1501 domain-containing protein [Reyranella sp. CPCC 100927]
MLRRDFLQVSAGLAVALATPQALAQGGTSAAKAAQRTAEPGSPRWDRILVLVELKGANDGLNTVIPFADPLYAKLRGPLAIARDRVVPLDQRVGLHPALKGLMEGWKERDLAVVQGVGYPYPNRSHFRSIEIWDTASAASQTLSEGWLAQAFNGASRPAGRAIDAVVVDTNALPATGGDLRTIVMQDAESFIQQARAMRDGGAPAAANPALAHVMKVRGEIHAASLGLAERMRGAPAPAHAFATDPFSHQLALATRILLAKVPVVAIKVALGGFDTHARQLETHERLLTQLGEGLAMFRRNLIAAGLWKDVLVMTYSEFGRRVKPNASAGTDHGTAAPHFMMGGLVKGGLHGAYPSLADLQDGDLKHSVDFRDLYATVARRWWGLNDTFGRRNPTMVDIIA